MSEDKIKGTEKDNWDKFHILMGALVPVLIFAATIIISYNDKEVSKIKTASDKIINESQIKSASELSDAKIVSDLINSYPIGSQTRIELVEEAARLQLNGLNDKFVQIIKKETTPLEVVPGMFVQPTSKIIEDLLIRENELRKIPLDIKKKILEEELIKLNNRESLAR